MAQPFPNSIPDAFAAMHASFRPERATGVHATIQFDFSGREPGTWSATVANGTFSYLQGPATTPDATVAVDADDWLAMLRGDQLALDEVMSGRLRIQGNMALMVQFQNWFERPASA
jgi:alkyl sulfatase BDS1-like metallo-beta-lactamase superfamily hydrolase